MAYCDVNESLSARVFASLFSSFTAMWHKDLLIFLTNSLPSELTEAVISDPLGSSECRGGLSRTVIIHV